MSRRREQGQPAYRFRANQRESNRARELERRAIVGAREGDREALHYLYVRHADDVYGFVQSIVRDHHDAEDITHNVFAKLLTILHKYEEREAPFAAWILRVARNAALDHLRARRQVPVEEVRVVDPGMDQKAAECSQSLREALAGLPDAQREVLVLRHIAGMSPNEIAERLNKTEPSIQGLHHRGRASLKRALRELGAAPVTRARSAPEGA